ncbi:MAG: cytochrome P450 [Phycisphaerales bacterium]|nr:cytochrome P450 [Phycisphaerales bacterium]
MLILRSEIDGTRIRAIDKFVASGARSPSGRPVIFVHDPSLAEVVLHRPEFDREPLARSLYGNGIVFSDGEHWRERRRIVQPSFPPRDPDHHLQDVMWAAPGLVRRFEAAAASGATLGVVEETVRYTVRVLYRGVFGQELPEDHDRVEFLEYFDSIGGLLLATIFPELKLDARSMSSIKLQASTMNAEVDRLVGIRRAEAGSSAENRNDVLGRIIEKVGDADGGDGVRDEVRSLLMAGAETTSTALSFLLLMLATHPEARTRLEHEIDAGSNGASGTSGASPFLDAVIFETLRLFPPVWFVARETLVPVTLGDRRLEKDEMVFVSTALIHRHPDLWAEPDSFMPERFLPGSEGAWQPPHRYAFFPFGGGRHLCLGRHVAMHELRIAAREIVRRFQVDIVESTPLAAELGVVLKPGRKIRVRVVERGRTPR